MIASKNVFVLLLCVAALGVLYYVLQNKETFESENSSMNNAIEEYLKNNKSNNKKNNKILRKDIESAARAAAVQYCPVPPDYNPSQYIKKTELEKEQSCPKIPDLKDYVLKSSIPPKQECPACVCPKVNITAEMCNQDEKELVCPPCKACGPKECIGVVECPSIDPVYKEATKESVNEYIKALILDKDYKEIYKLKSLLKDFKTPQDDLHKLVEENLALKKEMEQLKNDLQRAKMGEAKARNNAGVVSSNNKRKNNNSPVVDYAEKCENNRVNSWYDVAGVIGSPFNGMKQN
jgi:regulator of replication initiation timing